MATRAARPKGRIVNVNRPPRDRDLAVVDIGSSLDELVTRVADALGLSRGDARDALRRIDL